LFQGGFCVLGGEELKEKAIVSEEAQGTGKTLCLSQKSVSEGEKAKDQQNIIKKRSTGAWWFKPKKDKIPRQKRKLERGENTDTTRRITDQKYRGKSYRGRKRKDNLNTEEKRIDETLRKGEELSAGADGLAGGGTSDCGGGGL